LTGAGEFFEGVDWVVLVLNVDWFDEYVDDSVASKADAEVLIAFVVRVVCYGERFVARHYLSRFSKRVAFEASAAD